MAYSPDGKLLAVAHSRLTLWNPETGRLIATLSSRNERIYSVAISPDGRTVAAAGDTLHFFEVPALPR